MQKSKTIDVVVRVRCPKWLTAAHARREIRTLINEQTHYGALNPETSTSWAADNIGADNFRAVSVKPLPKTPPA